ncbi:hypothetical protein [Aliiglaciecola litoralis]|uniref:Sulfotransferase family protein n=1 Tax=Aliiglaciecola litoralis TaxID=582857 RepID=A0ABN1LK13_9ALTE
MKGMLRALARRSLSYVSPSPSRELVSRLAGDNANNNDYKRYVIFGHQRCGSSVLTSGLKSHPGVKAFAEVFTSNHITFNYPGYDNKSLSMLALRDRDNRKFLEEIIFCPQQANVEAVGFKVFPDQIDKQRFQDVWRWLADNENVSLIMLNRDNSLATLCSVTIAKKTGVWGINDATKRPTLTITLSIPECEKFFEQRELYAQMVRDKFKDRELLEISYETFASDIPKHFNLVQEFIGINPIELPVNDLKKETRSLSQIIDNYEELKAHFSATRWQSYFVD